MTRFTSVLIREIKKHSSQERRLMCAVKFFERNTAPSKIKRLSLFQIKQCLNGIEQIIPFLDEGERDNMICIFEKLLVEKRDRKSSKEESLWNKLLKFLLPARSRL